MTLPAISLPNDRYRRIAGFCLGALLGAIYGVVHLYGDRLNIPGAPLYQPPFGIAGDIAIYALVVGLLGLLTAWPRSGLAGTALAAGISAFAITGWALFEATRAGGQNVTATVITGMFVALPFWGLLVPVLGALRWVVSTEEEAKRDHQPWCRRVWQPLVLILVVGLVSMTGLYNPDARALIARTNQMLQTAQSGGGIPEPLADTELATRGQGPYELSWESDNIERFRIPRPGKNFDRHSVVVARFQNGWNLVCLYITLDDPPLCQGMEELPS
jgi:uncharacterized membrane protein YidH (DUF202 family)